MSAKKSGNSTTNKKGGNMGKMIGLRLNEQEEEILKALAVNFKITSKTYKTKVIRHLIALAESQYISTPKAESTQETGKTGQITSTTDTGL